MFLAKIFSNLGSLRVVALVDSIGLIKASTDYRGSQKVPRTTGKCRRHDLPGPLSHQRSRDTGDLTSDPHI